MNLKETNLFKKAVLDSRQLTLKVCALIPPRSIGIVNSMNEAKNSTWLKSESM